MNMFIHYLLLLQNSVLMVLKLWVHQDLWKVLFKCRLLGPTPRIFDSVGLGKGPRISISNKFPGDTDAIGLGTTL